MLVKSIISPMNVYIEFYVLVYISVLILGISITSSITIFKKKTLVYLSDLASFTRFKNLSFIFYFFFSLLGGLPPFLTFVTKFYILINLNSQLTLAFFLLLILVSLLAYYLSIFKFLRTKKNYNRIIQGISFKNIYGLILFSCLNIIAPFIMHLFCLILI